MKAGIVVFAGTNCDKDTFRACDFFGWNPEYIWHKDKIKKNYDIIFLPGGFSYGDYISAGRLAKFSNAVATLPVGDSFIVGICNGFQILCEKALLGGILTHNENTKFICEDASLDFWGMNISLPIAHAQGNYTIDNVKSINEQIFLKYKKNYNGSDAAIAGLYDKKQRVLGMMPHPERAVFKETGNVDGRMIFEFIENEIK